MSTAHDALFSSELFHDMNPSLLNEIGRLMTRRHYEKGEKVFNQGDPGDSLLVVQEGRLETSIAAPAGRRITLSEMNPGEVIGELSLLGHGVRTATVTAIEPATCWVLERAAFDVLRHDSRRSASEMVRRIGLLAVHRLERLYQRVAREITGDAPAQDPGAPLQPRNTPDDAAYLATTLFFREFTLEEVETIAGDLNQVYAERDSLVVQGGKRPDTLLMVVRGAVETSMRGAEGTRRLRLSGPGRLIGQVGLISETPFTQHIESRARENSVLLELPWDMVQELLDGNGRLARKFAAAVWSDTVRAVQDGGRPVATLTV